MEKQRESRLTGSGRQIIHSDYVSLMYRRALGELPDMGCAVRLAEVIKTQILTGTSDGSVQKLIDVGCAAGHYYRTLVKFGVLIKFYVGVEIHSEMVKAAYDIWSHEIADGRAKFILDDIESPTPLEKSDIIICYNSFMYYKSAKIVLKKFLNSSGTVIIRSYFSDSNYRILRGQSSKNNDAVSIDEIDVFDDEGNLFSGDYWTIYSHTYIEELVLRLEPRAKVTWLKDRNIFDSIEVEAKMGVSKRGGTQIVNGYEISYPLLQPWEILLITTD